MELSAGGEGIQYVTTGEGGEQQILIHGADGQSLLQGAQIIDGKLVLPQQYQYVTENGETVMLVYETPDGQQMVSENGEQIVFLDESQQQQAGVEGAGDGVVTTGEQQQVLTSGGEPQTTYIQQVGEDGQTFLQQVTTTMAQEPQQTFIQIATDEATGQQSFVQHQGIPQQEGLVEEAEDGTTYIQQQQVEEVEGVEGEVEEGEAVEEDDTVNTIVTEQQMIEQQKHIQDLKPGQSLLLPTAMQAAAAARQPQAQIHVAEGGPGSSTVVMVTSGDPSQDGNMAFMETAEGQVVIQEAGVHVLQQEGDEGEVIHQVLDPQQQQVLIEQQQQGLVEQHHQVLVEQHQQQYVEGMEYTQVQEGELQMNIQDAVQADGSHIQIKILKSDGTEEVSPQPIAVMNMQANEAAAALMMQAASAGPPEPEPVPFDIDEEPDEEGRITMIDPSTGELIRFLPQAQDDIPVLIHPEEFENDEPEEEEEQEPDFGFGTRYDAEMKMNKGTTNRQRKTPARAAPKLLSSSTVVVNEADMVKQGLDKLGQVEDGDGDDDEEDSDFDEENLTPKVVYERLLAQHRKTKECQVCGDLLESYPSLKDHLMEHAGYNPCECQICGKVLSTSSMRSKHERAHSAKPGEEDDSTSPQSAKKTPAPKTPKDPNVKKFECDICGRQMGRIEHLKRHQLLHRPGPTWRCIICEYSFKREDLAKDHIKKQHKDALEQEALEDLYEKLEYEGEDNHQHKSQWNPKAKSQRPGATPRPGSDASRVGDMDMDGTPKAPPRAKATPKPRVPKPKTVKVEDEEEDYMPTPPQKPKAATIKTKPTPKPKVTPSSPAKNVVVIAPKFEKEALGSVSSPAGMRRSGRTPKPKKLEDYASEEEIKKAERDLEKGSARKQMIDDSLLDNMLAHGDTPQADIPEPLLRFEELRDDDQEEEDEEEIIIKPKASGDGSPFKDARRTVGKTVIVSFQAADDQRGKKRKATDEIVIEEVVILDTAKTPKMSGKGANMWKPYKKSISTPVSTPKNSPAHSSTSTPNIPKGHKMIGEVTVMPQQASDRYEDDDFVYFDDEDEDEDYNAQEEGDSEEYEGNEEFEEDEDETVVIRGKKGGVTVAKTGSKVVVVSASGEKSMSPVVTLTKLTALNTAAKKPRLK